MIHGNFVRPGRVRTLILYLELYHGRAGASIEKMRTLFSQAQLRNKLIKSNLADQGLVVDDLLLIQLLLISLVHKTSPR